MPAHIIHIGTDLPLTSPYWHDVPPPDGWSGYTLPFTIQQKGRVFRPDPVFRLETYVDQFIPSGQTYYVSMTGNDANTGLSWAQALRSITVAINKVDAAIVYVGDGYYYRRFGGNAPARSMKIIGVGDVFLTSDEYYETGVWTAINNYYRTPFTRTIVQAYDSTNPDSFGDWGIMTKQPDIAGVDANVNSWYLDDPGNLLYVRTFDDRPPDANLRLIPTTSAGPNLNNQGNKTLYLENLKCYGGNAPSVALSNGNGGNLRFYAKNCEFKYSVSTSSSFNGLTLWGCLESILWRCTVAKSLQWDGVNYKLDTGITPKAIEYAVSSYDHGDGATDQPSTSHDGTKVVRIMGDYRYCQGTTILADVGAGLPNGMAWNLGCTLALPARGGVGAGVYVDTGVKSWNDSLTIQQLSGGFDLQVADAASAIYYRNMLDSGNYSNAGGILAPY